MQLDPKRKVTVYGCGLNGKQGPQNMSMEALIENAFRNKKIHPNNLQVPNIQVMKNMLAKTK